MQQTLRDAAHQQLDEGAVAPRSHHDQIGSLLVGDLRDRMGRASCHHVRQLQRRVETFLLQVLDLLTDDGLQGPLGYRRLCGDLER